MNSKQKLRKEADKLWAIKVLAGKKCLICPNKANQPHHFFYKSNYGHLRYELDNGIPLCQREHFILHHRDPKIIEDKIIAVKGRKWYNKLKAKALKKPQSSYQTIEYYKQIIEKLNDKR